MNARTRTARWKLALDAAWLASLVLGGFALIVIDAKLGLENLVVLLVGSQR